MGINLIIFSTDDLNNFKLIISFLLRNYVKDNLKYILYPQTTNLSL